MNQELHDELLRMCDEDQRVRAEFLNHPPSTADPIALALFDQMLRADARNAVRLRAILATFGWPGRRLVGDDGSFAVWIMAQHLGWKQDLQRQCLDLLDAAVARGDALPQHATLLRDNVHDSNGEPSRLFPKSEWRAGERVELPLSDEDRAAMDARRVAAGLPRLAELEPSTVGNRHPSPFPVEEVHRRRRAYYDQYASNGVPLESRDGSDQLTAPGDPTG